MAKSRTKNRGRRGGKSNNLLVWLGTALLPIIVLGLGGLAMTKAMGVERIDSAFCYDRSDQAEHVVFVDSSLKPDLSDQQLRDYVSGFERVWDRAAPNTRISTFTTARDTATSVPTPLFQMCRPPRTSNEQAEIGAPGRTDMYLQREFGEAEALYRGVVARVLSDAQNSEVTAIDSPIMEQLQSISRYDAFQGRDRSLTLISDGIQNSETARFCAVQGDLPSFSVFQSQPRYRRVEPRSFADVRVDFLKVESIVLPQPGAAYCTHDEISIFWQDYFESQGVRSFEINRLRHGG
ncbi:MAG: hypothetical protein CMK09_00635 [Ponticaulis sp.]|nr:hypothetical protein [Ponticaulis sp.]|tara:strand:+ start:763 stop:1641 length:879 start_codon:yes stop_codon:yes gene_type:complete